MTWVRDKSRSLRDNIMEHLRDRFEAARAGTDGYTTTWDMVVRGPLPRQGRILGETVALLDTKERKKEAISAMECFLTVAVEFAYKVKEGDDPATELNRLLLDIQRLMRSDINAGGLCLNIVESSSELDLEGPEDRLVGGIVFWEVLYRHSALDPSKFRGE